MYMKHFKQLFFCVFGLFSMNTNAQTVDFSGFQKSAKSDSVAKVILDNSQYLIIYDYEYARDAASPEDKRNGITMLQVGKRYNRFMDYNEFRFDSLMDATAKNLKPYSETGPMMMMAL